MVWSHCSRISECPLYLACEALQYVLSTSELFLALFLLYWLLWWTDYIIFSNLKEHVTICGQKIDRLLLQNTKLQSNPCSSPLKLLGCLFSHELMNGNPSGITNSMKESRRKSIQKLDPAKTNYIRGMYKF